MPQDLPIRASWSATMVSTNVLRPSRGLCSPQGRFSNDGLAQTRGSAQNYTKLEVARAATSSLRVLAVGNGEHSSESGSADEGALDRIGFSIIDWSTSLESVGLSRSQFCTNWMQNWTRRTQISKTGVLPDSGAQNIVRVAQKRVLNFTETGSQFGSHVPGAQMWVRKFDIVNIACFDAWQGGSSSATTSSVLARARRRKILRGFVAGLEVFPAVLLVIRDHLAARNCTRELQVPASAPSADQDRGKGVAS
uniref:Uncharacterized protein n=1 Tax=Ananas comosus var. bracteatus TaxID=296719 RepID=A0A6V7QMH2_ANACO|nr:unnamed protein product [Ananas comosus var. bracteatus]